MKAGARLRLLALSLCLPLLHFVLAAFFIIATMTSGANDRAIVWAEGDDRQLATLSHLVAGNGQFRPGDGRDGGMSMPRPASCGANARAYSFGSLSEGESDAARQLLEALVQEAGARVCLSNLYILNELPQATSGTDGSRAIHLLLQSQVLPAGMVLAMFFAFAGQLGIRSATPQPAAAWQRLATGLVVAAGVWAFAQLIQLLVASGEPPVTLSLAGIGMGFGFAVLIVEPCVEEVALRGWMLPLAERAIGTWQAAVLTTVLHVALQLPSNLAELLTQIALGSALAILYVRTRSLLACIAANALFGATAFLAI